MINDIGRRACGNGFGKLEGVGGLHPHATVAAYAGDACRGICTVDAEAEFGVTQTDKYGAERVFRAGRNRGYAVVEFFLNRFRDVPDGIERFGTDFVRTEVGLRHRFTHCDRINFCQFAVCVEEKALLRDVDNDVMAL